ncbi:MAG: sulfatase-like hydrolase/transferase, partial [Planctomycetaceae bacterium]|nr:sulfatase-like hydrolase/transferase [Planctomycetaceae bacterium]
MTQVEPPASKPVMFQSLRKIVAVSIGKLATLRITFAEGLVHVWALCGLAVSQPLYDRYSRRPVFFEIEGIQTAGLFGLAVMLSLVIPACVMAIELLFARCRPGVRMGVHLAVVGILNVCFALVMAQNLAGSHLAPIAVLGIGLPAGVVLSALYVGMSRWRMLLSYAAWGNVLFPVFFLYQATYGNPLSTTDARLSQRIRIAKPTPIVLIVFDEISGVSLWNRERGLDERIVPHFAKLASEGVWYRNATSVHPRTGQALPAILTGEVPNNKYEPQISRYPLNLFTLLIGSRDYSVTAFEPYSFLYPSDFDREKTAAPGVGVQFVRAARSIPSVFAHTAIPRVVDLPALPPAWVGISSDHEKMVVKHFGKLRFDWSSRRGMQMDHFLECLGSRSDVEGASKKTPCFFQHLAMPHIPWCYYPDGTTYLKDTGEEFHPTGGLGSLHEIWCGDPLAVGTAKFRYWMQLAAADRYVGRMLQKLKDTGVYDQSLVIVMGDHGVSFQPNHSRRQLHPDFSEDILSVPLLVKYPVDLERAPKGGTIDDGNVEILDILPTIADVIGMKLPTKPAGSSLLSVEGRRSVKRFDNDGK